MSQKLLFIFDHITTQMGKSRSTSIFWRKSLELFDFCLVSGRRKQSFCQVHKITDHCTNNITDYTFLN